ncbi:unnamed protein product [Mycena citricolor]|uniref:Major facilitator superfamily (MFS) profile domain-containing protein n=1 Tax=Mycena citricolor TaxID=2018698 RepID=A0AAD2GUD6_9AGAR|nr:unnamed protein product [Mycena citricolor]
MTVMRDSADAMKAKDDESAEKSAQTSTSAAPAHKSRAFYMSFVAIMVTSFLSALDLTAVGTALPTISVALKDSKGEFTWVGSAYALSSTAFIPLSGSLADAFGRRPVLLLSIGFFFLGSAIAGAAQNMSMMIAARTIQGIGGGGILNLTEVLMADLVPLAERGLYQGLDGLVWSFASCIGPPIGGALATHNKKAWRWLFFLNLPLSGLAFILVMIFLRVKTPPGTVKEKLTKVDWMRRECDGRRRLWACHHSTHVGRNPVLLAVCSGAVAVDPGGIILGLVLRLRSYCAIETHHSTRRDRQSNVLEWVIEHSSAQYREHGQVDDRLMQWVYCMLTSTTAIIYYLPVFFQACFGASPIRSAVDFLPGALLTAPFALIAGLVITVAKRYREVNWAGWVFMIVGFGLTSTLKATASTGQWVGFQAIAAIGIGLIFSGPVFPILAPLHPDRAGSALALFGFTRAFFQTWGIAIAGSILQNELSRRLPPAFIAQFPPHFEIAYSAIPAIGLLEEPLRSEVRAAFAGSMDVIWRVMIGVCGLGLLFALFMKEVPMSTDVDERYALQEGGGPAVEIAT